MRKNKKMSASKNKTVSVQPVDPPEPPPAPEPPLAPSPDEPVKLEQLDFFRVQNIHLRLMNINGQMRLMEIDLQKAMQERVKVAQEFEAIAKEFEHKYGVDIRKKVVTPDGRVVDQPVPPPGS